MAPESKIISLPTSFTTSIPYEETVSNFPEEIDDCQYQARDCLKKQNRYLYRCFPLAAKYNTDEMILDRIEAKIDLVMLLWDTPESTQSLLAKSSWEPDPKMLLTIDKSLKERQIFGEVSDSVFKNIAEHGCIMDHLRESDLKRLYRSDKERMAQRKNIIHSIVAKTIRPMTEDEKKKEERESAEGKIRQLKLKIDTKGQEQWQREADGSRGKTGRIKDDTSHQRIGRSLRNGIFDELIPPLLEAQNIQATSMPMVIIPRFTSEAPVRRDTWEIAHKPTDNSLQESTLEWTIPKIKVRDTRPHSEEMKLPHHLSSNYLQRDSEDGAPLRFSNSRLSSQMKKMLSSG